ncbi:hypothetical protein CRUP_011900 [Coryphaenoides rupestris]|nr:hypothetical protein CRUP_011900 [Coryphaenoides rupestris]
MGGPGESGGGDGRILANQPNELIISLPEVCLITTSTVLDSYLGPYIKSWKPRLSPLLALCVFLVCEQHRAEDSDWFAYINVLPATYTCPAYFSDDVSASFNQATACYEIRTVAGVQRYQQAFINYGSHDNQRLLIEYGFVAPGNPNSVVYIDTELLRQVLRVAVDKSVDHKLKFLQENNFSHNLTVSSEGPSWRLMTVLKVLALPQSSYPHWKAVLLGQQSVCEDSEQWAISSLLQHCDEPMREQLGVVRSLQQEERSILESCMRELRGTLGEASLTQPEQG